MREVKTRIGLHGATGDPRLHFPWKKYKSCLDIIVVLQVNDVLGTGSPAFYAWTLHVQSTLDSNARNKPPFSFARFHISQLADSTSSFKFHQRTYAFHRQLLPWDFTFNQFRSMRHSPGRFWQTRPDLLQIASTSWKVTS